MAQEIGFLPFTWETWIRFLSFSLGPGPAGVVAGTGRNKPEDRLPISLSFSISLYIYLSNEKYFKSISYLKNIPHIQQLHHPIESALCKDRKDKDR